MARPPESKEDYSTMRAGRGQLFSALDNLGTSGIASCAWGLHASQRHCCGRVTIMPELPVSYFPIAAAAISAFVSACIAWATARLGVRAEIQKLRLGVQQKVLEQLVAARLIVYPALYYLISELLKIGSTPDATALGRLLEQVNSWDSKHAILLGPHSTNVCYQFRRTLAVAASMAGDETKQRKAMDAVFSQAELLELALRSDLGIYGVEVVKGPGLLRTPRVQGY
jgi:hypothetical protein